MSTSRRWVDLLAQRKATNDLLRERRTDHSKPGTRGDSAVHEGPEEDPAKVEARERIREAREQAAGS